MRDNQYTIDGRIRFSEVDHTRRITLPGIVNYFQDCSTFQSEDLGLGIEHCSEKKRAWILSSWQVVVERYPKIGEKIQTSTWATDFNGLFGERNFCMTDSEGKDVAYANSLWVYMDMEKGLGGRAADALRINWAKNTSADGYIVEMYQGNKWVRVGKITNNSTTTFRKAGLSASTVYKFRVRAYKMSGNTALYGNYSATVTARTNPSIMKGVKIGGKAKDALRVNWTKNTSAQGYIVEMYKGGKWVRVAKITNGNTTTFRKAGLAKNTTYKFRVKAYYMSGKTALYGNYGSVSGRTLVR